MHKTSVLTSNAATRRGLKLALKDSRTPQLHDALAILFYEDRAQLLRLIDAGLTATGYVVPASSRKMLREALAEFGSVGSADVELSVASTQVQPGREAAASPAAPPTELGMRSLGSLRTEYIVKEPSGWVFEGKK